MSIFKEIVVILKGRTHRLLPPMSQPKFVVQRDNEWRAVYASRTADVYMNPATVPGWIKKIGGEPNEREKLNVATKLCGFNSFHNNNKRKKEGSTNRLATRLNPTSCGRFTLLFFFFLHRYALKAPLVRSAAQR